MNATSTPRHVVVIGAGITGLTTAYRIVSADSAPIATVTLIEAHEDLGGKIRTSTFAGIPVEEGPDAYLARVPHAVDLVNELGLDVTHPAVGHAAVWHRRLYPIPPGLLLGVPTEIAPLVTSGLLPWRAKVRAALEPFLPASRDPQDSIGTFIRRRFGADVLNLLVDPLVGSIYAADTNTFSLDMVPQLADLRHGRSIMMTARSRLATSPPSSKPVFDTPREGLSSLVHGLHARIEALGGVIHRATTVVSLEASTSRASGKTYTITTRGRHDGELHADAVVVCSPARHSADFMAPLDAEVAATLRTWSHASVVIATVRATGEHQERCAGLSGYLVPKPDQDRVTAVSFGSNKWAHWAQSDGSMILRISLGRDGMPTHNLLHEWDDERIVDHSLGEVRRHTGIDFHPHETRVTRWPESFPQYRPGHRSLVEALENWLRINAPGVFLAGASWHGIGLPACIADANHIAGVTGQYLREM